MNIVNTRVIKLEPIMLYYLTLNTPRVKNTRIVCYIKVLRFGIFLLFLSIILSPIIV